MIALVMPVFFYAFIPIVLIEAFVIKKKLREYSFLKLFNGAAISNLISSFAGIPLAWGIITCIQVFIIPGGGTFYEELPQYLRLIFAVTIQAGWLLPYEKELEWMVPIALLVLLIPFFYVSYWIEAPIVSRFLDKGEGIDKIQVRKAVWVANLYSYLFLGLLTLGYILYVLFKAGLIKWPMI